MIAHPFLMYVVLVGIFLIFLVIVYTATSALRLRQSKRNDYGGKLKRVAQAWFVGEDYDSPFDDHSSTVTPGKVGADGEIEAPGTEAASVKDALSALPPGLLDTLRRSTASLSSSPSDESPFKEYLVATPDMRFNYRGTWVDKNDSEGGYSLIGIDYAAKDKEDFSVTGELDYRGNAVYEDPRYKYVGDDAKNALVEKLRAAIADGLITFPQALDAVDNLYPYGDEDKKGRENKGDDDYGE